MIQLDNNPMVQKFPIVKKVRGSGVVLTIILRSWLRRVSLVLLLLCGTLEAQPTAAQEAIQHRWAGDVPIMNGLVIEPELGFAFDSPSGRIVMIFASTKEPLSKIITFYGTTLVQLGWTGSNGKWIRKDEKLEISMVQTERGPLLRIMLQPN